MRPNPAKISCWLFTLEHSIICLHGRVVQALIQLVENLGVTANLIHFNCSLHVLDWLTISSRWKLLQLVIVVYTIWWLWVLHSAEMVLLQKQPWALWVHELALPMCWKILPGRLNLVRLIEPDLHLLETLAPVLIIVQAACHILKVLILSTSRLSTIPETMIVILIIQVVVHLVVWTPLPLHLQLVARAIYKPMMHRHRPTPLTTVILSGQV